jgi:hypothetical protein
VFIWVSNIFAGNVMQIFDGRFFTTYALAKKTIFDQHLGLCGAGKRAYWKLSVSFGFMLMNQ